MSSRFIHALFFYFFLPNLSGNLGKEQSFQQMILGLLDIYVESNELCTFLQVVYIQKLAKKNKITQNELMT